MNLSFETDGEILIIRQVGVVDPSEVGNSIRSALHDTNRRVGSPLLWDATLAPAVASSEMLRQVFGNGNTEARLARKVAIVVANPVQYGLSRVVTAYAETHGLDVSIFYDEEEAKSWLRSIE